MKYIDSLALSELVERFEEALSDGSKKFSANLSLLSTKRIKADKKLYGSLSESPISSTDISVKSLSYLISTLNLLYPYYDFSSVRLSQFTKVDPPATAIAHLQNIFYENLADNSFNDLAFSFYSILEDTIDPWECEVFSYTPEVGIDSDPLTDNGSLWSINYFFHNKKLRRLLFLCFSMFPNHEQMSEDDMFDMM
ncbi:hypothetical protein GEMRC1_000303 [Eukaryota sp. GEM-RC1]